MDAEGWGALLSLILLALGIIAIVGALVSTFKKAAKGQTACENCGGNLMDSGFGKLPEVVGTCRHCGHRQSWVKAPPSPEQQ